MEYKLISSDAVQQIHDLVINNSELQGLAGNKSLQAVIARIENRISYGLIKDIYDLAASYAVVGHVFNDANKRTAYAVMETCLAQNGINPKYDVIECADIIIKAAQGIVNETELAHWLRTI